MKITALIPDKLIDDVKALTKGKNITESVILALSEWVQQQQIKQLNTKVGDKPLVFEQGYSAAKVRKTNRDQ